jgi:hypothetical protein
VALVRAAYPDLDAANVINRILVTARAQTDVTPDPLYGFGIVDAYGALTADVPLVTANPLGSIDDWVVVHRRQEGDPIAIPLGRTPSLEEEVAAATPPVLVVDTARISLPWVVSGIFGVAFMSVVISGVILALSRLKNR